MIQIVGRTDIYFNTEDTFLSDINYHLTMSLEEYEILEHVINGKENKIKISFVLNMKEKVECRSLLDYNSYAYDEFKNRIPSKVRTTYMQTLDIRPANKKSKNTKKRIQTLTNTY
ncbi:hypothetical protein NC661_21175 [Aquibacillus koreensis]|uniref:Uncharacterized protein n=2 Tax=Aquibacillus koreensis TaxID=279446 RepID=A0A9X4AKH8_9BACI|nr:hypothetical protein [Aquibacillus koreensis]MCT2535244.1 hypothetical protein [Aquibacillus koreensis]MDC3422859.1 hypothetical protein [Aquibacillus koreensis]